MPPSRRRRLSALALPFCLLPLLGALGVASCGGGGRAPEFNGKGDAGAMVVRGGGGRSGGSGGSQGSGGSVGSGGELTTDPEEPVAELRSPEADAIVSTMLSAACAVTPGESLEATPVDPESITFFLMDEADDVVGEAAGTPGPSDEYVATLDLGAIESGSYSLRCRGLDESGLVAEDTVPVFVDHGPGIEPISPIAEGFVSLSGQHDFVVRIRPTELFDGDAEAELAELPEIDIDGKKFTLELKDDQANLYWVEGLDFLDQSVFAEPPPGTTKVSVSAKNERGIVGRVEYPVYIDGEGPAIAVAAPAGGTIVGSRAVFTFEATDDYSGVDWSTLVVEAKEQPIAFDPDSPRWSQSGNQATLELDTTEFSVATQLSINVTVSDLAGNASLDGAESTYFLDQHPPVLSLDPPRIRVLDDANNTLTCSHAFDPVGDAAVDHGDDTNNLALFRALAWDATNEEQGQLILHFASVDESSLRLWLAPAGELVVDSDGDGICDNVSSDLLDVDTVEFKPLNPGGAAFFGDGTGDVAEPLMTGLCAYKDPAGTAPKRLCNEDSDLTYVLRQAEEVTTSAIYATLIGGGPACTGDQQSISALVGNVEGWICAAVRGSDLAGNQGISAPIAICVDNSEVPGTPSCVGQGPSGAPDCTDGCSPLVFPAGGMIYVP